MFHYKYIPRKDAAPYREEITNIIHDVQDEVREYFTFQYKFIGSSSRDMITYDPTTSIGFDFDVNISVNDENEDYDPSEIRSILRQALTRVSRQYGYNKCEDSTRVITIKRVDPWHSRIQNSCDFAIVYEIDHKQQYIRFNKSSNSYTWEYQPLPYKDLTYRADFLKENGYWDEVLKVYLYKKNNNNDPNKHSRALYAETINECYQRFKR